MNRLIGLVKRKPVIAVVVVLAVFGAIGAGFLIAYKTLPSDFEVGNIAGEPSSGEVQGASTADFLDGEDQTEVGEETAEVTDPQPAAQDVAEPSSFSEPGDSGSVCDRSQKAALTAQYEADIANAAAVRDAAIDDAYEVYYAELADIEHRYDDIWDPVERERLKAQAREQAEWTLNTNISLAETAYDAETLGLTAKYQADLDAINC
jgi:hypothetical protein